MRMSVRRFSFLAAQGSASWRLRSFKATIRHIIHGKVRVTIWRVRVNVIKQFLTTLIHPA